MTAAYRHEMKFLVSAPQYYACRQRLQRLLRQDSHAGPSGEYRITSLYLDDAWDSALFEKLSGVEERRKFRIRIYNGRDDVIMLEKKVKNGEGIHKERVRIDRQLYEAIRQGDPEPLREADDPLFAEVAWLMKNQLLRPKVIVDYVREAYLYPFGNVRITFDKHLRSGLASLDLFRTAPLAPVPLNGLAILEVKYDAFLPRAVQDVLQTDSLTRQAASKYVLCRTFTKTQFWEDQ